MVSPLWQGRSSENGGRDGSLQTQGRLARAGGRACRDRPDQGAGRRRGALKVQSAQSVTRQSWGENCAAWPLAETSGLSVKLEEMPAGSAEQCHHHDRARQVFFVLAGELQIHAAGQVHVLTAETALEVPPGVVHQARNDSGGPVRFLVISAPSTAGDRIEQVQG